MNLELPIYRAKTINEAGFLKDRYIFGLLNVVNGTEYHITNGWLEDEVGHTNAQKSVRIDPKTLAISIPRGKKIGAKKVFYALDKNGVGGDVINFHYNFLTAEKMTLDKINKNYSFDNATIQILETKN